MPDDIARDQVPLQRQYPVLRIFETAGVALSPSSIVIATATSVLLGLAGWLVDRVVPVDSTQRGPLMAGSVFGWEYSAKEISSNPWSSVAEPAVWTLTSHSGFWGHMNGLIRFGLALGIWSLVGIVLCRRSAFLFVGNDESTVSRAVDYGLRRWGASLGTPLIPLAAALLIGFIVAAIGLLGGLPVWGSTWLFLVSPGVAILGFAMAFLLLATMLAWPLMVAAVSVDDCESFGGLSRAYSILTGRPWQATGYAMLVVLVGVILMSVAIAVAETSIWCGMSAAALGCGSEQVRKSLLLPLTAFVHEFVAGVGISFFWSAATVIYLFLRSDVDGVPLDRIAPDDDARPVHDPLPVVGMPATDAKAESDGEILPIDDRVQ